MEYLYIYINIFIDLCYLYIYILMYTVARMLLIFSDMKLYFNIFCKENLSGVLTMFGLKM